MGCTTSSENKEFSFCDSNGSLTVDTAKAALLAGLFCDMIYEDTNDTNAIIKVS